MIMSDNNEVYWLLQEILWGINSFGGSGAPLVDSHDVNASK